MPIFIFPTTSIYSTDTCGARRACVLAQVSVCVWGVPAFINYETTLSNGYLGSRNDEERSEMRYVMRIAEFSESSSS
jgi:hypothetical protein